MKIANGKQLGIAIAVMLAFMIAIMPDGNWRNVTVSTESIVENVLTGQDSIHPNQLAQWIIEGREDFVLVDIRSKEAFDKFHLKFERLEAVHIPHTGLYLKQSLEGVHTDDIIVLYSNGDSHSAQAALALRSTGKTVLYLQGGLNAWTENILKAPQPDNLITDDEVLNYNLDLSISQHFGGKNQATKPVKVSTPKIVYPKNIKNKKRGGGC